jgi:effector-binding domain-containing protein
MADIKEIKEQVEQRLQKQQSSKEFKDIGRVAQTKKEKSAFRLINSKMLVDLEDDGVMAYNMVKKDNVWKEVDVQAERERGVSAGAVFMKIKIREAVPTRPKDEKRSRSQYVLFLENLQNDLLECFTYIQVTDFLEKLRTTDSQEMIISYLLDANYKNESADYKEDYMRNLSVYNRMLWSQLQRPYRLIPRLIKEIFGSRFQNMLFKGSDAAATIWRESIDKEPISEEASVELIKRLEEQRSAMLSNSDMKIDKYKTADDKKLRELMSSEWRNATNRYQKDLEGFRQMGIKYYENDKETRNRSYDNRIKISQPRDNDWSWSEKPEKEGIENQIKKPKEEAINTKEPLSYIKRTGGYKIEILSPREIIDKFGFNAVNYGIYVDDKWSKEHTKHFLGAMTDMGQMLNLDIKKTNQLGGLSIAFGAKGTRGALAQYFPQTKDINLTKGNGDGSVAHEWGHYFDNVIVELDQKRATNLFASDGLSPDFEIKALYKELFDFIFKGNILYTPKVPMTFYAKKVTNEQIPTYSILTKNDYGYPSWKSIKVELKDTIEATLENIEGLAEVDTGRYYNQLNVFGYIIDHFGLEEYAVPMKLKTSYYYHKSYYKIFKYCVKAENGKTEFVASARTKYWGSNVELWARAWETVILKKLLDKNRVSNYLVDGIPLEDIVMEGYKRPYPAGKELEFIETIIDKIVTAFKKKFGVGDFVAPSQTIENEYIELKKGDSGETNKGMIVEVDKGEKDVKFVEEEKVVMEVEKPVQEPIEEQVQEVIEEPKIEDVVTEMVTEEPTKEEIQETIDALQILADDGNEAAIETIEALKLLL